MLSKADLIKYEKPIADAYAEVESVLMENIAKHIASGKAWGTAAWEIEKLAEMGRLNEENARIINRYLSNVPQAVLDALKGASRDSYAYVESQASVAERLHAVTTDPVEMVADNIQAFYDQARESLNMVNTVMLESGMQAYLTATRDGLRWANTLMSTGTEEAVYGAFNTATQGVLTGAVTADEAKKRTIKKFADEGLTGFVDRSGRHWSPEAYTSMVIRSTVHNCSVQAVKTYMQSAGSNVFQCSWHPASRPTHYPYQGKFYSWDDVPGIFVDGAGMRHTVRPVSETGYGSAAGLFGVNCGHTAFAMVPGVSMPVSVKDMPDEKTNNERYNLLQAQRTMERNIRNFKTRAAIYEAAGDTEAARKEREKLWVAQRGLSQYVRDNNLTRDPERERVYGQGAGIRGVKPKGWTPAQTQTTGNSTQTPTASATFENTKGISDTFRKGLSDALSKCPHEVVRNIFEKYQDRLVCADDHYKRTAHYQSGVGVKFNASEITTGNNYEYPYQTAFHEFGHMIDDLIMSGKPYYRSNMDYNGQRLLTVIKSDWKAFKKANGYRNNDDAIAGLKADDMTFYECGSISDILEKCTSKSYPLRIGHGVTYHRRYGATEKEFFAETLDGAAANAESFRQMQRLFPNAVQMVFDMLTEDLNK